jgi:hypothetical protein
VPKGVRVEIPLQAYFRINTENMGQFERTLIIVDEDAYAHYVEGCTAPIYSSDSLHSAVVETSRVIRTPDDLAVDVGRCGGRALISPSASSGARRFRGPWPRRAFRARSAGGAGGGWHAGR